MAKLHWQPIILDVSTPTDRQQFDQLHADQQIWRVHDTIYQQVEDLVRTRHPRWVKQR